MKSTLIFAGIFLMLTLIGTGIYLVLFEETNQEVSSAFESDTTKNKKITTNTSNPTVNNKQHSSKPFSNQKKNHRSTESALEKNLSNEDTEKHTNKQITNKNSEKKASHKTNDEKTHIDNVKKTKKVFSQLAITLIDSETNSKIIETTGNISIAFKGKKISTQKFTTDSNGVFEIPMYKSGYHQIIINLNEYAIGLQYTNIKEPKEKQTITLSKGGKLFIKVTDQKGNNLESISATIAKNVWRPREGIHQYEYKYNKETNTHEYSKIPLGLNEIIVVADGFQNSTNFKFKVTKDKPSNLNIQLFKSPILVFNLLGANKLPETITIQVFSKGRSNWPRSLGASEEITLNDNNKYEYENSFSNLHSIKIIAGNHQPATVSIKKDKTAYDINLVKGINYKLKIVDETHTPIPGIEINYRLNNISLKATSNDKGEALLNGVSSGKRLYLTIRSKNYLPYTNHTASVLEDKEDILKEIVLKKASTIHGTVTFKEKPIQNANISLKRNKDKNDVVKVNNIRRFHNNAKSANSNEKGSFSVGGLQEGFYTLTASHQDYGITKITDFEIKKENQAIKIELKAGTSYQLQFSFSDNTPYESKNIFININNKSIQLTTNKSGLLIIKNIGEGSFYVNLNDNKYKLEKRKFKLPDDNNAIVIVHKKSTVKLQIQNENGQPITSGVTIKKSYLNSQNRWAQTVPTTKLDDTYLEITPGLSKWERGRAYYTVEVDGYLIKKFGPFTETWEGQKELQIDLQTSDQIMLTVSDKSTGKPLKFISVELWASGKKTSSLPTDENGELTINKPALEFNIKIKHRDYAPLDFQFKESTEKNIALELTKGGTINGKIKYPEDATSEVGAYLHTSSQQYYQGKRTIVNKDGTFQFEHIAQGEYYLQLTYRTKDRKTKQDKIQTTIYVENDKVTELNLVDDGETTLDIRLLEKGTETATTVSAYLSNRAGKNISSFTIKNGSYHFNQILPGEYFLNFSFNRNKITKKIIVKKQTENRMDIILTTSLYTITVKNEKNEIIPKALFNLYIGDKFNSLDSYIGQQSITKNGIGNLHLTPNETYYIVVEEELAFNYQAVVIGPISLGINQSKQVEVTLANARQLPKILITDENNNPLKDVAYITSTKTDPFLQRASWKAAGLYPYSDKDGYLPQNGWPLSDFNLSVTKEGYETLTVLIPKGFDSKSILQIKLKSEATITCSIEQATSTPISIGLLDNAGNLLSQPIPLSARNKKELNLYKLSVTSGKLIFKNLTAGTYYIGYFWNGTTNIIQKQGPITIDAGQKLHINTNISLP